MRILLGLSVIALTPVAPGCATILDIEEATCAAGKEGCDPAESTSSGGSPASDGGDPAPAEDPFAELCQVYCAELDKSCNTPELLQYAEDECETVCQEYLRTEEEVNPDGDMGRLNDTIECRIREAKSAASESAACVVAGLTGGDGCGEVCEVYCEMVESRCKPQFDTVFDGESEKCEAECGELPRTDVPFHVGITDGNSLECRFYHLQAAAGGGSDRHCEHVVGLDICID